MSSRSCLQSEKVAICSCIVRDLGSIFDRVCQVGWEWRGLAVWSPSGCRLVCSLRQTAQDAGSTPRMPLSVHQPLIPSGPGAMPLPLESGISALTWGAAGYSLLLTETASSGQVSGDLQP